MSIGACPDPPPAGSRRGGQRGPFPELAWPERARSHRAVHGRPRASRRPRVHHVDTALIRGRRRPRCSASRVRRVTPDAACAAARRHGLSEGHDARRMGLGRRGIPPRSVRTSSVTRSPTGSHAWPACTPPRRCWVTPRSRPLADPRPPADAADGPPDRLAVAGALGLLDGQQSTLRPDPAGDGQDEVLGRGGRADLADYGLVLMCRAPGRGSSPLARRRRLWIHSVSLTPAATGPPGAC